MNTHLGHTRDALIASYFNAGETYSQIGDRLGTTRNAIASVCRRLGLRRDPTQPPKARSPKPPRIVISAEEQAEREQDMRDLDMLADVREGHSLMDVAKHWGVTRSYISRMLKHARAA